MRKVDVLPYQEGWKSLFEEEADHLSRIFGEELIAIHHIGSTSVKGLKAKPIIDIMPVVKNIHQVDGFNDSMIAIGYEPKGENGIRGRRYFQKGGDNRTHHVHIYENKSPEIIRHLALRDYLRAFPEEAKAYGDLKERLAKKFPYQIESYIQGKERFVSELEQRALAWHQKRGD
ncbi:GrpB family protein [Radiobacillus kanasensis]|uniref:GrpB family protein n=1 Tax=Radiobacillus kanasensis TaxID=2844358 RepID=UPI001E57207F|nr:GrpB family protein [Radiobacillus kanasensis]UFT99256.1 GrpB family protein [Radiobacillus kanasensis]